MALTTIGHAALPTGSILQVVQLTKTASFAPTANQDNDVTGLTALQITPKFSDSKILISIYSPCLATNCSDINFKIFRDSTEIWRANHHSTGLDTNDYIPFTLAAEYLDSPSSTSQLTYKLTVNHDANELYINYTNEVNSISTFTAKEIRG